MTRVLQFDVRCSTFGVGRLLFILTLLCTPTFDNGAGDCHQCHRPPATVPPTSVSVNESITREVAIPPRNRIDQTQAQADAKSVGCLECHGGVEPMHKAEQNVVLGCTDCHGGNPARRLTKEQAHVQPRHKNFWKTSANPPNSSAWLNHESPEFIKFMNPGDLRVAKETCGLCHGEIVRNVDHSMMNHGAMLWGAALYNNAAYPLKNYRFGQAYGADGAPLKSDQLHAGHAGRYPAARHPALSRSASSVQPQPSRQCSPHFREGRTAATVPWIADDIRTARQTRASSIRARTRHS